MHAFKFIFLMSQTFLKIMHCPFNPNNFTKVSI